MIIVRIDKHPSDGSPPEHVETVTIANVGTMAHNSSSLYGVWRDGRSIQEAPDYTIRSSNLRPTAQELAGLALIDQRGI